MHSQLSSFESSTWWKEKMIPTTFHVRSCWILCLPEAFICFTFCSFSADKHSFQCKMDCCYIFFFCSVDLNVVPEILYANCFNDEFKMEPLCYKRMDFEEFCAAAISTYQLEAHEGWENIASMAFEYFEQEGNRAISVMELAQVRASKLLNFNMVSEQRFWVQLLFLLNILRVWFGLRARTWGGVLKYFSHNLMNNLVQELNLGPQVYSLLKDWIRNSDGKLNFLGYTKFLHGVTIRSSSIRHW